MIGAPRFGDLYIKNKRAFRKAAVESGLRKPTVDKLFKTLQSTNSKDPMVRFLAFDGYNVAVDFALEGKERCLKYTLELAQSGETVESQTFPMRYKLSPQTAIQNIVSSALRNMHLAYSHAARKGQALKNEPAQ